MDPKAIVGDQDNVAMNLEAYVHSLSSQREGHLCLLEASGADRPLKEVVEQLARGEVRQAIASLNLQGRVHEISDRQDLIAEIAREYVRQPESTLVVSPDNESRREINGSIHRAMQDAGQVKDEEHRVHVLYAR